MKIPSNDFKSDDSKGSLNTQRMGMIGKCLCGAVQFEVKGDVPQLYQCHCSLCRKTTGSSANAATFVHESNFVWLSGIEKISSFVKDTGYRSDFCSICRSPVPNVLRGTDKYWVPAGLLEDFDAYEVVAHLHTHSKASCQGTNLWFRHPVRGNAGLGNT